MHDDLLLSLFASLQQKWQFHSQRRRTIVDYESWRENCKEREAGDSKNPYNNGEPYPYEKSYFIPENSVGMYISFAEYGENTKYEEKEEDLARYSYYENKILKKKKQHEINIKKIADAYKNRNNFFKTWQGKFHVIAGFFAKIDAIGGIIFPPGVVPLCGFDQLNHWLGINGNSLVKEMKKELKKTVPISLQEQCIFEFLAPELTKHQGWFANSSIRVPMQAVSIPVSLLEGRGSGL